MNKEKMEKVLERAGVKPVAREKLGEYDVLIGDAFSLPPHSAHRRFDIEPDDFPNGMYVTWWIVDRDGGSVKDASLFFCDAYHDPEHSIEGKRQLRIKRAIEEARKMILRRANNATKH